MKGDIELVFIAKQRYRVTIEKDFFRRTHRGHLELPNNCITKDKYRLEGHHRPSSMRRKILEDWEKLPIMPEALETVLRFKYGMDDPLWDR